MMRFWITAWAAGLLAGLAAEPPSGTARFPHPAAVASSRLAVYAAPHPASPVLHRLDPGQPVNVVGEDGAWNQILLPARVHLWVHGEFLADGKVVPEELNLRSGPDSSHPVVGHLLQDATVHATGTQRGAWVEVEAPATATGWVLASGLQSRAPEPPRLDLPEPPPVDPIADRAPPDLRRLMASDETTGEGTRPLPTQESAEFRGVVRPFGYGTSAPGSYRLVEARGELVRTLCYLKGPPGELATRLGREVRVRGPLYRTEGVRFPLLVVVEIQEIGAAD